MNDTMMYNRIEEEEEKSKKCWKIGKKNKKKNIL